MLTFTSHTSCRHHFAFSPPSAFLASLEAAAAHTHQGEQEYHDPGGGCDRDSGAGDFVVAVYSTCFRVRDARAENNVPYGRHEMDNSNWIAGHLLLICR